jgi:N,N'-diacetyllegionaminate synthase
LSFPFIISEIAQAHEGSLGIAHSYIDALAGTGVNAVKFQTHIAEAESSKDEPFRVKFSFEDATRYDYWKRMEFTPEQWQGLKKHCEDKGMEFISSPFSVAAVQLLENLGVKRYKVGSGELTNFLMLDAIGRTGKPVILSSGMSDWSELDDAVNFLKDFGNHLSLLQCTTAYPTVPEQWGLNVMQMMKERYNIPIGFSDHSSDIFACLAAATLGAEIIEFHVVFDKQMFGPDAKASLDILQTKELVRGLRMINEALSKPNLKKNTDDLKDLKIMFGKSIAVNKSVFAGDIVKLEDLESKKPGNRGVPAKQYLSVIGKKWKKNLQAWVFVTEQDFE